MWVGGCVGVGMCGWGVDGWLGGILVVVTQESRNEMDDYKYSILCHYYIVIISGYTLMTAASTQFNCPTLAKFVYSFACDSLQKS